MRRHRKILTLGCCLAVAAGVSIRLPAQAFAAKAQAIGPPTNVRVIPLHTAVSVSWTAPNNTTGQQIDGYIVTATHGYATTVTCDANGTTSCVVAPLVNGENFHISVVAARALRGDGGLYGWIPIGKPSRKITVKPTTAQNCSYFGYFANLQGCDLSNANLSGLVLTDADMAGVNLTNANLNGTNLAVVDLQSATLTGTNLSQAFFNRTVLTGDNLSGAKLHAADFYETDMSGLDVSGADLSGSSLISGHLNGTNLTNANLTGASLGSSTLTNANLSGANLTNGTLGQDNLTGANFSGATLTGVTWNASTCPDGTNSSTYSPQTCVGHGI
jgi:uncharacterized protein YjbI with pentapeptide repeats